MKVRFWVLGWTCGKVILLGNTYQTIIDASKGIFVPRGVANGFQVLSNKVAYSYLFNDYWAL